MNWYKIAQLSYPLEDPPMYGDSDYKSRGGEIIYMSPEEFFQRINNPLDIDEGSRDNIEELKQMILKNRRIDPPTIYYEGNQVKHHDGRHRAIAAQELGIENIPVLILGDI